MGFDDEEGFEEEGEQDMLDELSSDAMQEL